MREPICRDVPVRVQSGPGFIFGGPGSALQSGSYETRPVPVRFSKFSRSGFSPPVRVSYFSGPGLSGPGFPTIFFVYNYPFSSYLSLGSMLDRFVLKNKADCISQCLKRSSGGPTMTSCYNQIFSSYLSSRTLSFKKYCRLQQSTSQRDL